VRPIVFVTGLLSKCLFAGTLELQRGREIIDGGAPSLKPFARVTIQIIHRKPVESSWIKSAHSTAKSKPPSTRAK
jgi:hypothetical protein